MRMWQVMFKSWCNHQNELVHLKLLGSGSMTISYLALSFASLFFFYNILFIVTTTYSWFYNTLQIIRYLSSPRYNYFEVNDHSFVLILCFLCFQGHWRRTTETTGGELSYKPPIYSNYSCLKLLHCSYHRNSEGAP